MLAMLTVSGLALLTGLGVATLRSAVPPLPTTIEEDFFLSGTQVFDVSPYVLFDSNHCSVCHSTEADSGPHKSWSASKKAFAGRNPLFRAEMTVANQLIDNAGYFCMRCHMPFTFVTGSAFDPSGNSVNDFDMDGVSCHLCHAMVDPIFVPGVSPPEDESILAMLDAVPSHFGNGMFVLDHDGIRRGPRGALAAHDTIFSPFHTSSNHCGTCHDVGNVVISKLPDGSYWFNTLGLPVPDEDPWTHFPIQRTFTEWKLSEFAAKGVDMGGRFGGDGHPTGIIHSCQDCHMPRTAGFSSPFGEWYPDLARHDFAAGSAWGLEMIGQFLHDDPALDPDAIERGISNAIDMLERAASLEVTQQGSALNVKVTNETGHKLPTGHIEGRRVFITVRLYDEDDLLVREYGGYDCGTAELDTHNTVVYEMHLGISEEAAVVLGVPAGKAMVAMAADLILKDSRIPPRGFSNAAFAAAGAPVVGHEYADGQYWDEPCFVIPDGAVRAEVSVNYQMMTRDYVEALRDHNFTDDWGDVLYDLWLATDMAPPIEMASQELILTPVRTGDLNGDGVVNVSDMLMMFSAWGACPPASPGDFCHCPADLNRDGVVNVSDLLLLFANWG
jgi:hypothetical protein